MRKWLQHATRFLEHSRISRRVLMCKAKLQFLANRAKLYGPYVDALSSTTSLKSSQRYGSSQLYTTNAQNIAQKKQNCVSYLAYREFSFISPNNMRTTGRKLVASDSQDIYVCNPVVRYTRPPCFSFVLRWLGIQPTAVFRNTEIVAEEIYMLLLY